MLEENHLHMYEKIFTETGKEMLICQHPDCTHKITSTIEQVLHKRARCYICKDSYVIVRKNLKMLKWRCQECRRGKPKKHIKVLSNERLARLLEKVK